MSGKHWAIALLALASASALAGGVDRSGQGLGALFERGNYVEAGVDRVIPRVEGVDVSGGATGDVVGDYFLGSVSARMEIDPRWSAALVIDQPYGANLLYGQSSPLLAGSRVTMNSKAALGLLRYRLGAGFSAHGGVRIQQTSGDVQLKGLAYGGVSGYRVRFAPDTQGGYVAGVSYEIPEIALRVAATYHGAITQRHETTETGPLAALRGKSTTAISMPQAVNLDFQTGVARNTLLFGQMRWVDWSGFRVDPSQFVALTGQGLIDLHDTRTYTLGLAQRFNERWSGAISATYEAKRDGMGAPLSPTNGRRGLGLAGIYSLERMRITAGVSYVRLGDALLETGTPDTHRATMSGNRAIGFGLRIGWML